MYPQLNFDLAANGTPDSRHVTKYNFIVVESASAPFELSFDGQTFFTARQNYRQNFSGSVIVARALDGVPCKARILHSATSIQIQDTNIAAQATILRGNFGIPDGFGGINAPPYAFGGIPIPNSTLNNGFLQVYPGYNYSVAAANANYAANGGFAKLGRRQLITFVVAGNSPAPLRLMVASAGATYTLDVIAPGGVRSYPCDDDFVLTPGVGAVNAYFCVSEMYLQRQ